VEALQLSEEQLALQSEAEEAPPQVGSLEEMHCEVSIWDTHYWTI
jgi:hypothetical protein